MIWRIESVLCGIRFLTMGWSFSKVRTEVLLDVSGRELPLEGGEAELLGWLVETRAALELKRNVK